MSPTSSPPIWSTAVIADAVCAGLRARAEAEDREQVVYGFDHHDELGLHPLIQQTLRDAGWGVWPEQRYPGHWGKTRKSEGNRCDVVLTERADVSGLRDPEIRGTLFDQLPAADPQDAYWLEIKTVAQHTSDGPFRRYTSELLSPVAHDARKLWSDGVIRHAGLLLVLFTAGQEIAGHDMSAWYRKCLERGSPVASPEQRLFDITDRIGNSCCAVGVFAVRDG